MINLLSVVEDPLDAVALAGALRSPFFCLSDDGLFWLATARHDLIEGLRNADAIARALGPRPPARPPACATCSPAGGA